MDIISNLPPNIIETILCFLPIQDAARTSILSKEWRYHWIKIPKLVFIEDTFEVSTAKLSVRGQPLDQPDIFKGIIKRRKLFNAIYQVLSMHNGPVHEFTLSMHTEGTGVELEQIMFLLSQKDTVKKLRLEFGFGYSLPLDIISFNRLAELHLKACDLELQPQPICNGFGNLVSLYFEDVVTSSETLLPLLSSCPLLKSLNLDGGCSADEYGGDYSVVDLFECLPAIENLTIGFDIIMIKTDSTDDIRDGIDSFKLENDSDIWLEHLRELEIVGMDYRKPEMDFVELIMARSPVLERVWAFLIKKDAEYEEAHIYVILQTSPYASPAVKLLLKIFGARTQATEAKRRWQKMSFCDL